MNTWIELSSAIHVIIEKLIGHLGFMTLRPNLDFFMKDLMLGKDTEL